MLLYYRTLALISQKGLSALTRSNLATIEAGKAEKLNADCLKQLCVAINSILWLSQRAQRRKLTLNTFRGFIATAGTTIQGSWNNAIGTEGEHAVKIYPGQQPARRNCAGCLARRVNNGVQAEAAHCVDRLHWKCSGWCG
ncbi:MAG: hypothetical protein MZV70_51765 [Desulfobacterales bacterium]|nr:hypothetical protein [Desulfobacterales bacterium]